MKSILLSFILLLLAATSAISQNVYVTNGAIEFDKTVNMWAIRQKSIYKGPYEAQMQQAYEQYKKTQPQFKVLKSSLSFSKDKTLYTPGKELVVAYSNPLVDQINTTYTDLAANSSISQKNVFGDLFLLKDNPRKITWKITGETREIAGYFCRRANALVMDSIYVVAFYTDDIPVSGGPESFTGLPGMILGVALPHENVTWFATKVTPQTVPSMPAPVKGKAIEPKELTNTLKGAIKNYPPELTQLYLKALLL